eukprot:m.1315891 g.1315891  ORF g.1315891 m.1315891 type:complete len:244 (+) comp24836_c0_seq19:1971-2702(+)
MEQQQAAVAREREDATLQASTAETQNARSLESLQIQLRNLDSERAELKDTVLTLTTRLEQAEKEPDAVGADGLSAEALRWKERADTAKAELASLEHVLGIKTKENREMRIKHLDLEHKLETQQQEASKTLSEIVRIQTQKEELTGNLEAKRIAHEQAVVDNAHLKEDLKSLEDDMKTLSADNQELRNMLDNYRLDMNKSGIRDPFGNESPLPIPAKPLRSSSPIPHGDGPRGSQDASNVNMFG